MLIVERVEDLPAGAPRAHQPHAAQQPELVRHGRLADADQRRDVADAALAAGERVEDADAGGIPEDAERVARSPRRSRSQQEPASRARVSASQMRNVAVVGHMNI